jgi:hypothetical protein
VFVQPNGALYVPLGCGALLTSKEIIMSTSSNSIILGVEIKGDAQYLSKIVFRKFVNGSVELTLTGIDKSNEWMVLNSNTIVICRDGGSDIITSVLLPEQPCFDDAIRYERIDKDEFSVLFVPLNHFENLAQEYTMPLDVSSS